MRSRIQPRRGEEFLCLLARGQGFKGSGRPSPGWFSDPPAAGRERGARGDGARAEQGPGTHPAASLAGEHSGVRGPPWICSSPGWLCARCAYSWSLLCG